MPAEISVCTAGGWMKRGSETVAQADSRIARDIDGMADTGFAGIRWDWPWKDIEQKPGVYNFERRVATAQKVRAAGLKILPIVGYTPKPYQQAGLDQNAPPPPQHYDKWDRYLEQIMPVLKDLGIDRAEVWNESNHHAFWHYPNVDVQAELVRRSLPIIARLHPTFRWVLGAFSPAPDKKDAQGRVVEINPVTYVKLWYEKGYKDLVKGPWSIHPYQDGEPGEVVPWSLMTTQYEAIRAALAAAGHPKKRIWGTEFGHTTRPKDGGGRTQRSEAEQARLIVAQIEAWRAKPNAGPAFLFNWQEFGVANGNVNGLGIMRLDGTYKPAREALKELLT